LKNEGVKRYSPTVVASEMMLPMQIHELLGAGIRAARLRRGWRQQDAAERFRMYGLPNWNPTAVGQVETGVRKPSIGELLLACAALEVSIADLIQDVDDRIDLGTGATMTPAAVRELLSGDWPAFSELPPENFDWPGEPAMDEALARAGAERDRQRRLLQPLADMPPDLDMYGEEALKVFLPPTEAEARAADRLGVEAPQLKLAALKKFGHTFEEERDARSGAVDGLSSKTVQARRGHATRAMLTELRTYIDEAHSRPAGEGQ
jgi:transcriptional regulator with XRE-family HTH domain